MRGGRQFTTSATTMVSPKKSQLRAAAKRSRHRRIVVAVAILFTLTVLVVGAYTFLLRDVHHDADPDSNGVGPRRLRRQQQGGTDAASSAPRHQHQVGGAVNTKATSPDGVDRQVDRPTRGSNGDGGGDGGGRGISKTGKRWRRKGVTLTAEEKAERRKALARSLVEQRAKAAKDAGGGSAGSGANNRRSTARDDDWQRDDDWRRDGFAQKPAWWDRYQKVQAKQARERAAAGVGGGTGVAEGLLEGAAAAWDGWSGTDALDGWWDDEEDEDDDDDYYSGPNKKNKKGKNSADPLKTIPSECYLVMSKLCTISGFSDPETCRKCTNNVGDLLKESANCRSRHFSDYCGRTATKEEIR